MTIKTERPRRPKEPDRLSSEARTHVAMTVKGESVAMIVASFLIRRSVEFHLDPFPDDNWNFVFKNESGNDLKVACVIKHLKTHTNITFCDGWD